MLAACFVNSLHWHATLTLEPKWLRTMMMMTTAMSIINMLIPSVFVFSPDFLPCPDPSGPAVGTCEYDVVYLWWWSRRCSTGSHRAFFSPCNALGGTDPTCHSHHVPFAARPTSTHWRTPVRERHHNSSLQQLRPLLSGSYQKWGALPAVNR